MRILLIVDCYLPIPKSASNMIHGLGCELCSKGHDVFILTPDHTQKQKICVTKEDGLTILRVRSGQFRGVCNVVRAINELRLSSNLWKYGKEFFSKHPCDLIVFYSPSIFFGDLVEKLKRLWGAKVYLILRDIFPQWAVDAGLLSKGFVYKYFCKKERKQYKVADKIGVQSPANLDYFEQGDLKNKYSLEVLYNWIDLNDEAVRVTHYREQFGLQNKIVFFYGGNIGQAQDMDNIIRLAMRFEHIDNVHFLLVGEGSEKKRISRQLVDEQIRNITIYPSVSQPEYFAMLSEFDIGLISLDRHLSTHNFPGKMLGYMYFGLPILASINPNNDIKELIEESAIGFVCTNGEDEKLFCAAKRLIEDESLRNKMGIVAKQLLQKYFVVSKAAEKILSLIEK